MQDNNEEQNSFADHLNAVRTLIKTAQELTNAKIYWKSNTAMQIHWVVHPARPQRVKYLSNSRAKMLHDGQMSSMKELGIPVLDMFDLSYDHADMLQTGDGRHYLNEFNDYLMDYFYPVESGERKAFDPREGLEDIVSYAEDK